MIPNQVSSERSTAMDPPAPPPPAHAQGASDGPAGPGSRHPQPRSASGPGYAHNPPYDTTTSASSHADRNANGNPASHSGDYRAYAPARSATGELEAHAPYYPPQQTPSSTKPTLTIHPTGPVPGPPTHSQHPPIATLDNSPIDPNTKRQKSMFEPPQTAFVSSPISATPGAGPSSATANSAASKEGVKRTKTSRACDPCRRKKIRCDVLQGTEPPICAHCKQYGFDCTFFLPITETRWKKRKLEEDDSVPTLPAPKPAATPVASTPSSSHSLTRSESTTSNIVSPAISLRPASEARPLSTPTQPRADTRIYGPTSLTYILHSSSTMPAVDSFDLRYHQTWRVGRSGEGFIQIYDRGDPIPDEEDEEDATRRGLERDLLQELVNFYFENISPLFPVVTKHEFLHGIEEDSFTPPKPADAQTYEPSPVLLYAICTIAATARQYPAKLFDSLRIILNHHIRTADVMSIASLTNIQALLITGMTAEAHGRAPGHSISAAWLRVSAAIRMAQDLGLHRAEAAQTNLMLRRRLWAACVISDRWYALTLGLPFLIDVHDCDARLPGLEVLTPQMLDDMSPEEARDARSLQFMAEFVKLSVLLGKITKAIYSPTGLIHTTDETLERLQAELENFMPNLPIAMRFRGPESDIFQGMLHLCHACLGLMFWRVFARIQYTMPAHLTFAITVEAWTSLTVESARAIQWLSRNEMLYDSWLIVAYSLTSCALTQYHTWARRADDEAQSNLRLSRDIGKRWEQRVEPGHMQTRKKTTEIISLLFEATQSPVPRNFWPLNPTAGVEARNSASADAIVFRKDPSRPGRGFFIATERTASALGQDMPGGTVVVPDAPPAYASGSGPAETDAAGDTTMGSVAISPAVERTGSWHEKHAIDTPAAYANGEAGPSSHLGSRSGDPNDPAHARGSLQPPPPGGAEGPYAAAASGGYFAVPVPNYQHPYYVPDASHYHQPHHPHLHDHPPQSHMHPHHHAPPPPMR
ncbi:hypothetical protein DL93DRAFT_170297 [Clavulina sp. PMI_390]|nr:hypothetical protein DL93DRAFT_170297 [Clavulina sp. PMI_390]